MRRTAWMLAWLGLAPGAAVMFTGCGTAYDEFFRPLSELGEGEGGASSGSGINLACAGEPNAVNTKETCGVFARADAMGASEEGTREKPYKTLQAAIEAAANKTGRVYACSGAPFIETVKVAAGVEIYGGFDCASDWAWKVDTKSELTAPPDAIALTVTGEAKGLMIKNFTITAPTATIKGGSSIAVVVDDVEASFVRCEVKAGDGLDGEDGALPSGSAAKGGDAPASEPTKTNACISGTVTGGLNGVSMCDEGSTAGGLGGRGGIQGPILDGLKGANGDPFIAGGVGGVGGLGASTLNPTCFDGGKGKDGETGSHGAGGPATTSADKLSMTGLSGGDGADGATGKSGQGGGGGGGAKAGTFCTSASNPMPGNGASGGGGGAGGCGGKGGGGGKAGGSSIAIVSMGVGLTLTDVTLSLGKGGKGGNGTAGFAGGGAGKGAAGGEASGFSGSKPGCQGGNGGLGGDGGAGGGGRGGHTVGVGFAISPSAPLEVTLATPGTPGTGGKAGVNAPMTSNGAGGWTGACWDFSKNVSCSK